MNSDAAQLSETPLATPATSVVSDESADAGGAVLEPPCHATSPESAPESVSEAASAPEPVAQNPRHLLKTLQTQFPVFRDCLPLAIGIDKAIKLALPEVNKKALRIALSLHTHGNRYLRGMTKATERFDLEGSPAGEVTEEHRQHATDTLRERMKKQADERRAAQKAERERQKAERAEQTPEPPAQQKTERPQPPPKPKAEPREKPTGDPAKTGRKQPKSAPEADAGRGVTADKLALLAQKFSRH